MNISEELVSYIDKITKKIQKSLTRPIVKITKTISATIIVIFILIIALSLLLIGTVRALNIVLPIWGIYYIFAGIFLLLAMFFIRKSNKE